jgi:hypothetical protein
VRKKKFNIKMSQIAEESDSETSSSSEESSDSDTSSSEDDEFGKKMMSRTNLVAINSRGSFGRVSMEGEGMYRQIEQMFGFKK